MSEWPIPYQLFNIKWRVVCSKYTESAIELTSKSSDRDIRRHIVFFHLISLRSLAYWLLVDNYSRTNYPSYLRDFITKRVQNKLVKQGVEYPIHDSTAPPISWCFFAVGWVGSRDLPFGDSSPPTLCFSRRRSFCPPGVLIT